MKHAWAGLALLVATPSWAQDAPEWVAQAPLPDLVVAFEQRDRGSTIVERVPPDETVQQWSVMATNQRFAGLIGRGATLDDWLGNFLGGLENGCPGYRATAPRRFTEAGRPALELRLDCPRNPATGLPETFFLRAIAGRADLHVAQVAFRRSPSAADVAYAEAHLASVRYCQRNGASPACIAAASSPEAR
jgi:hypothetical protein